MKTFIAFFVASLFILATLFDPSEAAERGWMQLEKSMPMNLSDHTATRLSDSILLAGGCVGDQYCVTDPFVLCSCSKLTTDSYLFFPSTSEWKKIESKMPIERFRHGAAYANGKVYVIGGRKFVNSTSTDELMVEQIDVFDVSSKTWSTLPSSQWIPGPNVTSDLAAVAINNVIYAIGGYIYDYSPSATVWTFNTSNPKAVWEALQYSLNVARGDLCAVDIKGRIFIAGGYNTNFCKPLGSTEFFNHDSDGWTFGKNLDVPRGLRGLCATINKKVHVIGGEKPDKSENCVYTVPFNHTEALDEDTGRWSEENEFIAIRFRAAVSTWSTRSDSVDNIIYHFGGQKERISSSKGEVYPITDSVFKYTDNPESTSDGVSLLSSAILVFSFLFSTFFMF